MVNVAIPGIVTSLDLLRWVRVMEPVSVGRKAARASEIAARADATVAAAACTVWLRTSANSRARWRETPRIGAASTTGSGSEGRGVAAPGVS